MRSIFLISLISFAYLNTQTAFGAELASDSTYRVESRYHHEYNPWFKLGTFKRGFSNSKLRITLDSLEIKPRTLWTRIDSLEFASTSLKTGNIELSEYYFNALDINYDHEEKYWYDHLTIHLIKGEYENGLTIIRKTTPGIVEFSKLYFYEKILIANINNRDDSKWIKSNLVLHWEVDSSLIELDKKSLEFEQAIIEPLKNLEYVLQIIIHYIHEDDPVLAMACFEMGQILEFHVSLTQAYISYSLGRHYNKRDKILLNNIRGVKAKLMQKNLKIPVFRKYFPRIEYWRFDYDVLKEKVILMKGDTIQKFLPDIIQPRKKRDLITFPKEYIILGGLLIMFLCILIFLKTNSKK